MSRSPRFKITIALLLFFPIVTSCVFALRQGSRTAWQMREKNPTSLPTRDIRVTPPRPDTGGSDQTRMVMVKGRRRTFLLYMPSSAVASQSRSIPLVLAFHGGRGNGRRMASRTQFSRLADQHGFLVAYPNGYRANWNDGRGTTEAERRGVDDVAFVQAIIDDLAQQFSIDRTRVYAVGLSNGGIFANRLGCELADRLAAVAVVAGPMATPVASYCAPRRPISVLGLFGTADPFIPWQGGEVQGGDRGPILCPEATIDLWGRLNNCRPRGRTHHLPIRVDDGTAVQETTYTGCRGGREVVLYTIRGGGHAWPPAAAAARRAGKSSRNLNASEVIWAFFASQPPR